MATTTALVLYRGQGSGALLGQLLPAIGGILNPTGSQPPAVVSDYNWPASPWQRPASRSLPPETRRKVARALFEATLEVGKPEPAPKPRPKRRPAKPSEVASYQLPTARKRGIPGFVESARILITPPPKVSGRGYLQGRSIGKSHVCALNPSGGGEGTVRARGRRPRTGALEPKGIENLTDEQMLELLEAA